MLGAYDPLFFIVDCTLGVHSLPTSNRRLYACVSLARVLAGIVTSLRTLPPHRVLVTADPEGALKGHEKKSDKRDLHHCGNIAEEVVAR